jgi:copper transport protein
VSRRLAVRVAAGLAALSATLAVAVALAVPAFAHAQLLGTSPTNGSTLRSPPAQVVLTFGEAVQAPPTAIELYNANGQRVTTGPPQHPANRSDQVSASLPPTLKGTYIVSWRVISADTHPVQGAFTFSVGTASGASVGSLEQHLLAARHPSRGLGVLVGALRTLILVAVIVAVGGAALLVGWPGGIRRLAMRLCLLAAIGTAAVASTAALILQGPYDAGKPIGDALRTSVFSPVLHSSFGTGAEVRVVASLVMLVGVLVGLHRMRVGSDDGRLNPAEPPRRNPAAIRAPAWLMATLAGSAGLVVSLSLSGHARSGRWEPVGFITDLVHVAAASIWVGGLVALAALLFRPEPDRRPGEMEGVVRRFSSTALIAVGLIVVSGVLQAWRQVGSWGQLTETDYGTVLLLKVTLVVVAIEAGWFSRRWVGQRLGGPGPEQPAPIRRPRGPGAVTAAGSIPAPSGFDGGDTPGSGPVNPAASRFRRWLAFETAIAIGVVALTGVLVDTAPPQGERAEAAALASTHRTTVGSDSLSVAVYPLVAGTVHVGIQLTDRSTEPVDAFQMSAQVSLPSRHIGPLSVPLSHQSVGSWVGSVDVPLAGHWTLLVSVLTDPITDVDRTFPFTIYG